MIAACSKCGRRFQREADEGWKKLCLSCWRATRKPEDRTLPARTVDEFGHHLRELLQLCHPDRHNGSPLAARVTQWLLRARRELR
jgi:hypothetical protein